MRYTTPHQDAMFYAVFICGLTCKQAERLIFDTFDLLMIDRWSKLGAAASDDGFEALSRWANNSKQAQSLIRI